MTRLSLYISLELSEATVSGRVVMICRCVHFWLFPMNAMIAFSPELQLQQQLCALSERFLQVFDERRLRVCIDSPMSVSGRGTCTPIECRSYFRTKFEGKQTYL